MDNTFIAKYAANCKNQSPGNRHQSPSGKYLKKKMQQ